MNYKVFYLKMEKTEKSTGKLLNLFLFTDARKLGKFKEKHFS